MEREEGRHSLVSLQAVQLEASTCRIQASSLTACLLFLDEAARGLARQVPPRAERTFRDCEVSPPNKKAAPFLLKSSSILSYSSLRCSWNGDSVPARTDPENAQGLDCLGEALVDDTL